MADRFVSDPGFEGEILHGAAMKDVLETLTQRVRDRASDLFPDDPRTVGRDLHSNIEAEVGLRPGHGFVGRVNAFDFKAGWFEFGTARIPATHALSRALEENVGHLEKGPDD